MKTLLRVVVPLFALFALVPSSRAASPAQDHTGGWLGLMLADGHPSAQSGDATDPPPASQGVRIRGVVEGSPADMVRLRAKDSIVAIDGAAVSGAAELIARVSQMEPGSIATLSVKRGGHDLELSPVLGTRPDNTQRVKMIRGWLGVEAIELPASLREHFGAPDDAGVLVSNVVEGSPADDAGIRVGDVIYEADGQRVTSAGALSEFVSEAGVENDIDVVLARDGARIVVGPRIARAPEPPQR
jgi:S1-C subfamily serine protease